MQALGRGKAGIFFGGFLPSCFLRAMIRSKSFNSEGIIIQYLYLISLNSCVIPHNTKPNNSKRVMIAE